MDVFNAMKTLMASQGEETPSFPRQLSREAHLGIIEEMYTALLNYSDHVFDLTPILAEEPRHGSLLELLADAELREDGDTPEALADQLGNLMTLQAIAATVSVSQGFHQDFSWPKFLRNTYTKADDTFSYLAGDTQPLKGIIVLEGPDCTGKTTLANHLVKRYGAKYIHGTWSEEIEKNNHDILMNQIYLAKSVADDGGLVIIDRSWITEFIYADVFRGGTNWPDLAEDGFLELIANDAIYVFCLPFGVRSEEKHRKRFLERANNGDEMYLEMGEIVKAYQCFLFGNKNAEDLSQQEAEGKPMEAVFTPFQFNEDHRPNLLGKFWPEEDNALGSLRACIFDMDLDSDYEKLMDRIAELKGIKPTM